jgi:hypothetical protein
MRRTGVGRRLLAAVRQATPAALPLIAETDTHSVGFYTATGFAVVSLREKYPGVERFHAGLGEVRQRQPPQSNPHQTQRSRPLSSS